MRWRKVLGLAGFVGVAASGVLIVREDRRRRSHTPQEVRDRLHARLEASAEREPAAERNAEREPEADPEPVADRPATS